MTLREDVFKIVDDVVDEYCDPQKATDKILALIDKHKIGDKDYTAIANNVKTLIESQKCEWIPFYQDPDYDDGNWNTGCGQEIFYDYDIREHLDSCPFCPCCGKKIEVKT